MNIKYLQQTLMVELFVIFCLEILQLIVWDGKQVAV